MSGSVYRHTQKQIIRADAENNLLLFGFWLWLSIVNRRVALIQYTVRMGYSWPFCTQKVRPETLVLGWKPDSISDKTAGPLSDTSHLKKSIYPLRDIVDTRYIFSQMILFSRLTSQGNEDFCSYSHASEKSLVVSMRWILLVWQLGLQTYSPQWLELFSRPWWRRSPKRESTVSNGVV